METPNTLEQEVADIERQLAEKRAVLEQKKQSGEIDVIPHEKETLHEVVGEKIQEKVPQFQPSAPAPVQPQPAVGAPSVTTQPSYLSEELKDKIQELVNIAFQISLDGAIKKAQETDNPALIDAFHAVLVDELYQYLVDRGKLKKL